MRIIYEVVGAFIVAGVVYFVMQFHSVQAPVQIGRPPSVLEGVPVQEIKPARVIVYAPEAKAKAHVPEPFKSNANAFVIGSSVIPASNQDQTATSVFNFNTGETTTIIAKDPQPWFQPEHKYEIRLSYGLKSGSGWVSRGSISDDLLQVKSVHLGVIGSLDSDGDAFAGVSVAYRW